MEKTDAVGQETEGRVEENEGGEWQPGLAVVVILVSRLFSRRPPPSRARVLTRTPTSTSPPPAQAASKLDEAHLCKRWLYPDTTQLCDPATDCKR